MREVDYYELVNHLGNVLVVVSDARVASNGGAGTTVVSFAAVVNSAGDFYCFGSGMENRSYQSSDYKYGQNGQEKDDEITGSTGAIYSADYWEYDTRTGRRWNVDPVVRVPESPYSTFRNNPVIYSDPLGNDPVLPDSYKAFSVNVDYTWVSSTTNPDGRKVDVVRFTQVATYKKVTYSYDQQTHKVHKTVETITTNKTVTLTRTDDGKGNQSWSQTTDSESAQLSTEEYVYTGGNVDNVSSKDYWTGGGNPNWAHDWPLNWKQEKSSTHDMSFADANAIMNADAPGQNSIDPLDDGVISWYKKTLDDKPMGTSLYDIPNDAMQGIITGFEWIGAAETVGGLSGPGSRGLALSGLLVYGADKFKRSGFFTYPGETASIYQDKQSEVAKNGKYTNTR